MNGQSNAVRSETFTNPSLGPANKPYTKCPCNISEWNHIIKAVADTRDGETVKTFRNASEPFRKTQLQNGKGDELDDGLLGAIFSAIKRGDRSVLDELIRFNSKILGKKYGDPHRTALHEAVEEDQSEIVRTLLGHSRIINGINTKNSKGQAALQIAAQKGRWGGILEDLVASGAEIDVFDVDFISPLHAAVLSHQPLEEQVVSFLIDNGAKVNTLDRSGNTPLHAATEQAVSAVRANPRDDNPEKIMRLLLQSGADPDAPNKEQKTPRGLVPGHAETIGPMIEAMKRVRQVFDEVQGKSLHKSAVTVPKGKPKCATKQRELTDRYFSIHICFYYRKAVKPCPRRVSVYELVYGEKLHELEKEYIEILRRELKLKDDENEIRAHIWKWVHFPANNMTWIKDFVMAMAHQNESPDVQQNINDPITEPSHKARFEFLLNNIRGRREKYGQTAAVRLPHCKASSASKFTTLTPNSDPPSRAMTLDTYAPGSVNSTGINHRGQHPHHEDPEPAEWKHTAKFTGGKSLSLVLPYIDFEMDLYLERHTLHADSLKLEPEYEKMLPRQFSKMMKLTDLYKTFNGTDAGHQSAQSLDQSYYTALQVDDLRKRDEDQVVFKWFQQERSFVEKEKTGRSDLLGSCEEHRQPNDLDDLQPPIPNEQTNQVRDLKAKIVRLVQGQNEEDAKLLMIHQLWLWKLDDNTVITAFPERWHIGFKANLLDTLRQSLLSGNNFFQRPEQLIQHIVMKCAKFHEEFQYAGLGLHVLDVFESCIAHRSNQETGCFKEFQEFIKKSHHEGDPGAIAKEVHLIYEVKDICDELHLIMRVLEHQYDVLTEFTNLFWPGTADLSVKCRSQYMQDTGIQALKDRTKRLRESAERIVQAVDYLVTAKQTQFSLYEARSAGKLNNYILLFTVVTVIFTPLSFITALLALPISSLPRDAQGDVELGDDWFAGHMFAGELTTLLIMGLSILIYWKRKWVSGTARWAKQARRELPLELSQYVKSKFRARNSTSIKSSV